MPDVPHAGVAVNPRTLAYVLAAYTEAKLDYCGPKIAAVFPDDLIGYQIGAGIETLIAPRLALTGQWRYTMFENENLGDDVDLDTTAHTVRVGLAYRFGGTDEPLSSLKDEPSEPPLPPKSKHPLK